MITCNGHPQSANTCRKCRQQAKVRQFTQFERTRMVRKLYKRLKLGRAVRV